MDLHKWILSGCCLLTGIVSGVGAAEHTNDSLDTVKKHVMQKKAVLVDVRENNEWNDGHLKDAVHLPLSRIKKGVSSEELSQLAGTDTVIYLHCRSGARCLDAANRLEGLKRDLRPLEEGYDDLLKAGFAKAK